MSSRRDRADVLPMRASQNCRRRVKQSRGSSLVSAFILNSLVRYCCGQPATFIHQPSRQECLEIVAPRRWECQGLLQFGGGGYAPHIEDNCVPQKLLKSGAHSYRAAISNNLPDQPNLTALSTTRFDSGKLRISRWAPRFKCHAPYLQIDSFFQQ